MRGDQITQNRELYCQARMRGLSQRRAYREAYPRSRRWKDSAVDRRASELEGRPEVSARLRELRRAAAAAAFAWALGVMADAVAGALS